MDTCEMCQIRETMERIMKELDALPDISEYHDEHLAAVYNAADDAALAFRDMCYQASLATLPAPLRDVAAQVDAAAEELVT